MSTLQAKILKESFKKSAYAEQQEGYTEHTKGDCGTVRENFTVYCFKRKLQFNE